MKQSMQEKPKPKSKRKSKAKQGVIRWGYVLPRLAILLVVGLTFRFGLDPTLKWVLIAGGESVIGAKVEVASLRTSLIDGEFSVQGLAIANPQSPMRNVLESPDSQLQVDMNALLHGRVVVNDGTLSGLQFDTKRETSGALAEVVQEKKEAGPSLFTPVFDKASEAGAKWFNQVSERLDTNIADQLQSPRVANELQQRWPTQYQQLQMQISDIRSRGKQLEKEIREIKSNPLRGIERLGPLKNELANLQREVTTIQQQIANLPKQAEADRAAIQVARQHDEALIRQKLQLGNLDGEGLTQTLLGQPVTEGLASALGWMGWAREQIPTNSAAKQKKMRGRGTTVRFGPAQPNYLIKHLQLNGMARLNGQLIPLTGTLTDASDAPHLLAEPTRLALVGNETMQLDLEVVLDRRTDNATDQIHLSLPRLVMAERTLGNTNKLAIDMKQGVASFQLDVTLEGDQLSGEMVFEQNAMQLNPRLAKSPNGKLAQVLKQSLAGVERLEANVTLAGTLKKPKVKIDSDIGTQVATGINSSVQRFLADRQQALLASSREKVDQQLQKLNQVREKAQGQLLAQLGEGQQLLGQLATLTGDNQPTSRLPASIPQLGSKLRLDAILKK